MDLEQEKQLIENAKADIKAFGNLYDRYYSQIFGYVLRRTADVSLAQDITSEVFFKAMNNLREFQWRGIPFSAWLYRIATREIVSHYRKNSRWQFGNKEISDITDLSEPSAEDELIEAEAVLKRHQDFLALQRNITKLSVKYQEVITLRYFEHKQIKEITKILGKQEGTVKSLIHRGLGELRKLME
jgi:RNA polymerase sigma-70 factor (ECF subfamily)